MKIEIDIPDSVLIEAAYNAWKVEFRTPEYGGLNAGVGWQKVQQQVQHYIVTKLDASAAVSEAVSKLLPLITRDVVTVELKKIILEEFRAQKKAGTLMSKPEAEDLQLTT
jgi:uncharacterized protein (DUF736 family)